MQKLYPRLADALRGLDGFSFLMLGSSPDKTACDLISTSLSANSINLSGQTSLRRSAALIRRSRLLIGNESAAAHIASAVHTPAVVILGGGDFGRFYPTQNTSSAVSLPLSCYSCNWDCRYPEPYCITGINPDVLRYAIDIAIDQPVSDAPRIFVQGRSLWKESDPAWQWPQEYGKGRSIIMVEE